ncbi:hypothetical protein IFT56_02715 [Rhizobium sp. CFBP 13717]|uniref:hypothetical protein n=2 Tax=unclassified Rhizobium TaxID=2613769 RepID=UPI0017853B63|nr:hypothetical protein [Rhizobium sp. CFBP 13717]MBD8685838.1 hypothetical protein [Rhizobium sp. CFBP 13644]MBD8690489.1 hypothetical protein [Rhizobium sp. CFBP 13717]
MRPVFHMLMFLAWLLYGAMPAQAAFGLSVPTSDATSQMSHEQHADHAASESEAHHAGKGDPCPHRGSMSHAPFCAACIVLIPQFRLAKMERLPHGNPKSHVLHAFIGTVPAPPLPPPRA